MRGTPRKGEGSGAAYSGYTVFAGELKYDSPDNGKGGYKVYIGPGQVNYIIHTAAVKFTVWLKILSFAPKNTYLIFVQDIL